jgi:cytoskeletal protein CcmA (bactofilin family)
MKILIKEFGVTLQGEATITGNVTFQQNISVLENIYVSGNLFISGSSVPSVSTLNITGSATFNNVSISKLIVTGASTFGSLLSASGISVSNNLSVVGNLLSNNLIIAGGGTFLVNSPATFNSDVIVKGAATFNNITTSGLFVTNNATFNGSLFISGPATFNQSLSTSGLFISNNATFNNALFVSGSASFNSTITTSGLFVDNNATFNNALFVSGSASFNSTISTSGLFIDNNATFNNALFISGSASFNSTISTSGLFIDNNATFNNALFVSGGASFNSTISTSGLYVSNNATFNGSLFISGPATFNHTLSTSGLFVSNNATFLSNVQIGRLVVDNNATIGGTFLVNGGTTFASNITIVGGSTFNSVANFNGNVTFGSTVSSKDLIITGSFLSVAGSTFNAPLYVSGTTTFNSNLVTISGRLNISGGLHVTGSSTFSSLNSSNILVNNTQTTPDIVNYVTLDNGTISFDGTFGINRYIATTYTLNTVLSASMSLNNNNVLALTIDSSNTVYLGGSFTTPQNRVASFTVLGTTLNAIAGGFDNTVRAIKAIDNVNGNIVAGGDFSASFSTRIGNYLAFFTGANASWRSFTPNGISDPTFNAPVYAITTNNEGEFWAGSTGPATAGTINRLAKYHNDGGGVLLNRGGSINGSIMSLLIDNNDVLYVGGKGITMAPNGTTGYMNIMFSKDVDSFSRLDFRPGTWDTMNHGIGDTTKGVLCMAADSKNNIYAGGDFTSINNSYVSCNYIAKWDGTNWSRMGNGPPGTAVNTIAIDNNDVVFVGTTTGIYRWNGRSWVTVATTNAAVNSLHFDSSSPQYLYVGGGFTNFTNNRRFTRIVLPYKNINITNTVFDNSVGNSISSIVLKDIGENVAICATNNFGYIVSKSNDLKINYN